MLNRHLRIIRPVLRFVFKSVNVEFWECFNLIDPWCIVLNLIVGFLFTFNTYIYYEFDFFEYVECPCC